MYCRIPRTLCLYFINFGNSEELAKIGYHLVRNIDQSLDLCRRHLTLGILRLSFRDSWIILVGLLIWPQTLTGFFAFIYIVI